MEEHPDLHLSFSLFFSNGSRKRNKEAAVVAASCFADSESVTATELARFKHLCPEEIEKENQLGISTELKLFDNPDPCSIQSPHANGKRELSFDSVSGGSISVVTDHKSINSISEASKRINRENKKSRLLGNSKKKLSSDYDSVLGGEYLYPADVFKEKSLELHHSGTLPPDFNLSLSLCGWSGTRKRKRKMDASAATTNFCSTDSVTAMNLSCFKRLDPEEIDEEDLLGISTQLKLFENPHDPPSSIKASSANSKTILAAESVSDSIVAHDNTSGNSVSDGSNEANLGRQLLLNDPRMIKKKITGSDLGNLCRLLISKKDVQRHILPGMSSQAKDQIGAKEGLKVMVWDSDTDTEHEVSLHY